MGNIGIDLLLAVRSLKNTPGPSLFAASILAIAIAGLTSTFTLFSALVLQPLPVPDSDRLMRLNEKAPAWNLEATGVNGLDFSHWQASNETFEAMATYASTRKTLFQGGQAESVNALAVSRDLLRVLGLQPVAGRTFTAEEDSPGGPRTAMLSRALWQERFEGSEGAIGSGLELSGEAFEVIGVLPAEADFLEADLWIPAALDPEAARGRYDRGALGKLRQGVSVEQAVADLTRIHRGVDQPANQEITTPTVQPLREALLGNYRQSMTALLSSVGLLLALACLNIAALRLIRGVAAEKMITVQAALGASRGRLVRQLLAESFVLAAAGTMTGLLMGRWILQWTVATASNQFPSWVSFAMDWRVAAATIGACVASALIFGLSPALAATKVSLRAALGSASTRSTAGGRRLTPFIVGQTALSLALLIAGIMAARSLDAARHAPLGFRVDDLLVYQLQLPDSNYSEREQTLRLYEQLLARTRAIPGVRSANMVTTSPFHGHSGVFLVAEGAPASPDANPVILSRGSWPGYFETMGIQLLRGRDFNETELGADGPLAIVLNESLAQFFFGNQDPIGRRVRHPWEQDQWMEVVGVAADVRHYGPEEAPRLGYYMPFPRFQGGVNSPVMVINTAVEPTSVMGAAQAQLTALEPEASVVFSESMRQGLNKQLGRRQAMTAGFGYFALGALLLATCGVYGVISYATSRRTKEIGLRMALGAAPNQILGEVLGGGMRWVALGISLGLAGGLALARVLKSVMYGVETTDPWTFAGAAALMVAAAAAANWLPARRASRAEPLEALRYE